MLGRDFKLNPYTKDEQRVAKYLVEIMPNVGFGDDPIGFLMASHASIRNELLRRIDQGDWNRRGGGAKC